MNAPDIIEAMLPVAQALEGLSIPYYIGGSVASSIYGIARATLDIDLVADIQRTQIAPLAQTLRKLYYVDELTIAEAIERRSSFNLIHLPTSIKIDVFVPPEEPYPRTALRRRREETLQEEGQKFPVATAEDMILNKLQWYELGGRVSERQWLDVTGVIKVQGGALDTEYLRHWGRALGLTALLVQAFADSGAQLS
ncbi:MAG: nucleotidyl transferase AbiEii/AbiGii toxin family protein [Spirochaetales bacterium]|nr:nucleotidyl transferase AbiEii/AbiGii toxin family protein [Spirochaetales bacterium]